MSTTAPSKRQVQTNSVPSRQGLADWADPFFKSSVGGKYLVAITGLILTVFVIVHMLGNLQFFLGPDAINGYAETLKRNAALLWVARAILLAAFIVHIAVALWLNWKARQARPVRYSYERTVQASFASRHMVITGLVILVFTLFHIAHYTLAIVSEAHVEIRPDVYRTYNYLELLDAHGRPDVYRMMIYGFHNPIISVLYILAQLFLFLHLTHGVASLFQTVGLNAPRAQRLIRGIAWTVALVVCLGNVAIVIDAWLGTSPPSAEAAAPRTGPVTGPKFPVGKK